MIGMKYTRPEVYNMDCYIETCSKRGNNTSNAWYCDIACTCPFTRSIPLKENDKNKSEGTVTRTMKNKCSGLFCEMQAPHDTDKCELVDTCKHYTPVADTSAMELVIDMMIKQFGLDEEKDKDTLRILCNTYVAQYIAMCNSLSTGR